MTKVFSLSAAKESVDREDIGAPVTLQDEAGDPLMTTDEAGTPIPAVAVVVGKHSATFRKIEQTINNKMLKRRVTELTHEILEQNELEKLAACVKSWNLRDGSTPIVCDKDNVITVLKSVPWIRTQIATAVNDSARFLG